MDISRIPDIYVAYAKQVEIDLPKAPSKSTDETARNYLCPIGWFSYGLPIGLAMVPFDPLVVFACGCASLITMAFLAVFILFWDIGLVENLEECLTRFTSILYLFWRYAWWPFWHRWVPVRKARSNFDINSTEHLLLAITYLENAQLEQYYSILSTIDDGIDATKESIKDLDEMVGELEEVSDRATDEELRYQEALTVRSKLIVTRASLDEQHQRCVEKAKDVKRICNSLRDQHRTVEESRAIRTSHQIAFQVDEQDTDIRRKLDSLQAGSEELISGLEQMSIQSDSYRKGCLEIGVSPEIGETLDDPSGLSLKGSNIPQRDKLIFYPK